MKTKTLGRTGIELPIIGIGTAWVGVPTHEQVHDLLAEGEPNQVNEELGVKTIIAAMEAGCTFFDTAPLYCRTVSEKIIGLAFKERPELAKNCIVTTKVGRHYEGYDYSFDAIIRSVHESLERMGLDKLEVVYIHDAMDQPMDMILSKDGPLGALRKLQDEGIIDWIGTAANDPPTNIPYIETGEFDAAVIADSWSLLNLTAEGRLFEAAEKHNVGLVGATPVERGILATGPEEGVDYFARNFSPAVVEHVGKIKAVCDDHHVPILAVALQWCVRHPFITSIIPGARIPAEAIADIEAAEVKIPDALWNDLQPLVKHWEEGVDR